MQQAGISRIRPRWIDPRDCLSMDLTFIDMEKKLGFRKFMANLFET